MSMIAIYHFLKAMGLDQTLLALILVYSGGAAMNYYIAKGFFDTIPKSLDEAAILDGATRSVVFLEDHSAQQQAHRGQYRHQRLHRPVGGFHLRIGHHEG